jgi:four helix bundle protein
MGSAVELSYHFLVARDLGFLDSAAYDDLLSHTDEVMKMLAALHNRVRGKATTPAAMARAAGAKS